MGVFRNFPYSNFHEMNMDEIIKIIKNMLEEWATYHAEWDRWMDEMEDDWSNYQDVMNEAWQNMQDFINNYFDNLDVQEEINNKIVSMIQTGEFGLLVNEYIPPAVNAWLNLNITEPVGVIIDSSLTVAGACADAKATGDAINALNSSVESLAETSGITVYEAVNILGTDGNFEDFTLSASTWYKANSEATASVENNVLTFNANKQFGSLRHNFQVTEGHLYYLFATVRTTTESPYISINVGDPLLTPVNDGNWNFVSGIYTAVSTQTVSFIISDSSSVEVQQPIYVQKCGVIDLTAMTGAGNEPSLNIMNEAMHTLNDFIVSGYIFLKRTIPQPYENKKILFMGDSITAANLNNNGWCKYFNAIINPSKSVNVAVSGAVWHDYEDTVYDGNPSTYNQTNNTIGNQVEKIARGKDTTNPNYLHVEDYDEFDVIIISAGTNDSKSDFSTDDIKPSLVDSTWGNPLPYTSIDTHNAVGAMIYAYERLYTMYPDASYFYCTPIQTYPPKKLWGENQYKGDVMKSTGDYIPPIIIDTEKCGIFGNQEHYDTEGVSLYDGLHPNAHGAKLMGEYNANAIIKYFLGR